ncbi:MAG: ABC transporter permease subunit [Proteiniphilum sp.]|jgi:polar amino acid transport system substrate-binding protein|nr:ABC transporter permease subunit [Proteiniphilum sp.]MDD3075110.1 ABC transporter permease subunit [Proteiniphilum sp.]MDD4452449.1 ABC transporter permease subunit [Proteiniphilum sp.]NCB25871.1 transporter substrate-binding domain-containing protein [Bacteroidia bacterium]
MKKELPFFVLFSFLLFFYACSHEHEQKVTHLSELESSQFAVVTGTIADQLVWSKFPNAECAYYNSPLEACIAVQQGIEVAAAYDEPILRNITAQNPGLKILPDMVTVDNYGMAVRKSDTHLKYAADSLLEAMKKDGRYDDMKNRWFPAQGKPAKMPVMEWEAPNGVLHFGTNAVTEPFSFVDDTQQIVGFDIEFVSLLAQSLGMKLEIHNMEFGSLIASLLSQKTDIIGACMTITEERAQSVLFTDPYYTGGIAVVVQDQPSGTPDTKAPSENLDGSDLSNAVVGAMTGSTGEKYIRDNYQNATVQCYDDIMDAIAALQSRKLDYVITAYTTALKAANKNDDLLVLPEEYSDEYAAIAFHKNNEQLLKQVDAVLARFKQDGTLDSIVQRWVKKDKSPYQPVEIPKVTTGKPLIVAIAANREPMCFISDNKIVGLDCELIERIAYELGRPIQYYDMKFSALIAALESGKADMVISNMTATAERRKVVNFSDGYFVNPQVLVTLNHVVPAKENDTFLSGLKDSFHRNIILENRYLLLWSGLKVTFLISIMAALLGTLLGAIVCMMRMSKSRMLRLVAKVYIDLLRGIPQVVLLMLMFYVVFSAFDISGVWVATFTFAMNFAAYVSEMFRTSIESVKKGQTEAGVAMGFSKTKTFLYIVLPQAVQRVLPVYKGEFIALVKMTSIVGYIAVQDLTKASDIIRSRTFDAFFPLIMVAILYFLLAWSLTLLLEKIQVGTAPKRKNGLQK